MSVTSEAFEARLGAVVNRVIPGCRRLVAVERLSGGASQETYRITVEVDGAERQVCMRRAPGGGVPEPEVPSTNPGLATEAQLMRLAREAGVPEPEVYHVLTPEDDLGEGFIMEWLEGEALGARIARAPEFAAIRPKLAFEIGQVMARIHSIDLAATGLDKLLNVNTPETFVRQTWERYQLLETPQPMIDFAARWLLEHLPANPRRTLVHNDLRNGNFMVNEHGINAVLDWEVAHIGDPMRDLGWICTNSWRFGVSEKPVGGFGEYQDLFDGYESVANTPVDPEHVRFWEVFGSFWWAVGCLGMAEHYRSGPDKTVERPAIGRRSSECQVDCVNLLMPGPVALVAPRGAVSDDLPRIDELLVSVRDFLREDVMAETRGRSNFLARVAGNSLDIVLRELELGEAQRVEEHQRLRALLDSELDSEPDGESGADDSLSTLRWRLTRGLRDGSVPLDLPGLAEHLRATVVNQIAIDQPRYSGFKTALGNAGIG